MAKYYDLNFESKRTYLGSVGYFDENEYRALRVDVSSVLADYPDAAFRVAFQRAKDTHPYEKNLGDVTLENNKLVVVLKEVDYNIAGSLRIQITFESGSVTGKSSVFLADVGDSLSSDTTDPKSPYADALAEIDEALDKIDEFISTGGGSIALDKTLTVEGKAADAKAVGDALNALEEKIPDGSDAVELDTTLTQSGKAADAKAVGDAIEAAKGGLFVVTADLATGKASHSASEIIAAYNAGKQCALDLPGMYLEYVHIPNAGSAVFRLVDVSGKGVQDYIYEVREDKTIQSIGTKYAYDLPIASESKLGGVMPETKTSSMTQAVGVDSSGKLYTEPGGGSGGSEQHTVIAQSIASEEVSKLSVTLPKALGEYEHLVFFVTAVHTSTNTATGNPALVLYDSTGKIIARTTFGAYWAMNSATRMTTFNVIASDENRIYIEYTTINGAFDGSKAIAAANGQGYGAIQISGEGRNARGLSLDLCNDIVYGAGSILIVEAVE